MSPIVASSQAVIGIVVAAALGLAAPTASFAADDGGVAPKNATACIADLDSGYSDDGGKYFFTMNFQNNCDKPITCSINAYITSFRGPISTQTILHFPAKAQTPARKSYAIRVNAMSGTVQAGRSCNFL